MPLLDGSAHLKTLRALILKFAILRTQDRFFLFATKMEIKIPIRHMFHLHFTFLGTKPNKSVDPILREASPETQFKKMIKACIYILQSFSTYFISFDLHNHMPGLG